MISNYIRPEIRAMGGYVPGEQPRGKKLLKLNTNENPYRASDHVYGAIQRVIQDGLSRYPNPFGESFREAAARLYGVEPNWILCGNGSDDILTILTRTFVGSGELLRLAHPSYILYRSLAEIQGAWSEEVHFNRDWSLPDYFWKPVDLNSPYHLSPPRSTKLKLVFLPNPNSPTGTMISPSDLEKYAESLPCPLLIDEAYVDFAETNCIELVKRNPKIMVSRTMSKSYALAGLRFGFLIAQPQIVDQLIKVKDSYNCDTMAIAAATAAIEDQDWLHQTTNKILATRRRLTDRMRDLGFEVPESSANFTWNVHPDENRVSHKRIADYLKENGFLVRYMKYEGWGDGLRISVGTDEQTDQCIDRVEEYFRRGL